jgi:hypothetical protein
LCATAGGFLVAAQLSGRKNPCYSTHAEVGETGLPKITSTTVEALVLAEALGLEMKPKTQMLSNSAGT